MGFTSAHHNYEWRPVQPLLDFEEMADVQEIPQITTELIDMTKEYLRQQTIEPAKRLGKHAGMGIGGSIIMGFGAIFMAWGLYHLLQQLFPDGPWWVVLSRLLTAVGAAGAAGLIAWRLQVDGD
jgi:hypothetical protein